MTVDRTLIHRILVIKLRAIGDVLLSTGVLEPLRSAFPEAQIDFLTERPSKDVLEGNPYLNNVLVFDSKKDSGISLILNVARRKYDLVIDLFGNPRSAIVTYLSGAKYRVGFRLGWRKHCYDIVVEPRGGEVHNTQFNLDAVRAIGIPATTAKLEFPIKEEQSKFAREFWDEHGLRDKLVVAVNAGGGWYTKRWPIPRFAELADRLVREYGAEVLIIWGPGERADAEELRSLMNTKARLIPPTSLKQLGAILRRCSVMVTNDSGPMHIAATLGAPILAIFGPTNPDLQGPVGERYEIVQNPRLVCLGCNFTKCPIGHPCMLELSVDEVMMSFKSLIEKHLTTPVRS